MATGANEPVPDGFEGQSQCRCRGGGREGVGDIVPSDRPEPDLRLLAPAGQGEVGRVLFLTDAGRRDVGLPVDPVGDDLPAPPAPEQIEIAVVGIQHGGPPGLQVREKLRLCLGNRVR